MIEREIQPQNECERLRHFLRMNEIVARANAVEVQFDAENNGIVSLQSDVKSNSSTQNENRGRTAISENTHHHHNYEFA